MESANPPVPAATRNVLWPSKLKCYSGSLPKIADTEDDTPVTEYSLRKVFRSVSHERKFLSLRLERQDD